MVFTRFSDEQDAFESDFESTDEEGVQEDVDAAAEKMVHEEEKRAKKVDLPRSLYHFVDADTVLRGFALDWTK
jgi:hypothetical protein